MEFKVEEKIIPPKEMIVGDPEAKVLIVEYGDYESAETAKIHDVVQQLLKTYKGKIKYNFRHFPLTRIHQRSFKAAEAAIAAGQEGKFWEMHNILLQHQRNLCTISLKGYAHEVCVIRKQYLDYHKKYNSDYIICDDQD